jgi:multiple sugar transport system permease protein
MRRQEAFAEFRNAFTGLRRSETISGYLFILPNLLLFLTFTLFPIGFAFYLTFTDWDLSGASNYVGFANFEAMSNDKLFWKTTGNSLYYTFVAVPTGVFVAFWLATMMNRQIWGRLTYRTLYFLPHVTLAAASALVWNWIYHPDLGLLNYMLEFVGIQGPRWLHSTTWAMPAVIVMSNWMGIAPAILIFLAGLQGIPVELLEAAEIDGANAWQKTKSITLPLMTPAIFFVVVTSLIGAMQAFTQFYIMTQGGPAYATTPLVLYIFRNAFEFYKMGYAATIATALFGIILVITVIQWRVAKSWVYGFEQ